MINAKPRIRRLFRLRTILLIVMLSILFLPIGSLYFFRFYENELVRKTELELITQSAVLSAVYRELIGKNDVGRDGSYTPVEPLLDFSKQKTLPRRPDARDIVLGEQTTGKTEAQLAGQKMQTILQNTQKVTLAGMRILDASGVVVAGRSELNQSLAHVKEIRRALNGHYTSVFRERVSDEPPPSIASLSRGTGVRVFTAFPIMDNDTVYGVVYLSRTPQNILKHLYGIKKRVIFLSLLLLGLTGLFVVFLSSRISRPIRELIDQTQKVTSGELETVSVLRQPGTYELAKLSNSFSEMSHTLHERSDYIQQFASYVSHEFKTPLTSMQGALELLLEHGDDMPVEQQQRFLENLKSDSSRLERLVNGLLEQARADSLSRSTTSCNLVKILERLKTRFSERELVITFDENLSEVKVKIAGQELETVFNNLFDNSLQHGASNIEIEIISNNEFVTIRLRDNGSGISEANQKQIFTPFFTTRRETGGTGLGLGIIQSILKASNGKVTHVASDEGAIFDVSLQLSID